MSVRNLRSTLVAAAVAAVAVPAAAVTTTVNYVGQTAIPANNDFQTGLAARGLFELTDNATITLSGPAFISVFLLGSESGFANSFTLGSTTVFESDGDSFAAPQFLFSGFVNGGLLDLYFRANGTGPEIRPGNPGFGVFLPAGQTSPYVSNTLILGFDDIADGDNDHDDFIVKINIAAVPEPASWVLMIAGFGMIGIAARRRSSLPRVTA